MCGSSAPRPPPSGHRRERSTEPPLPRPPAAGDADREREHRVNEAGRRSMVGGRMGLLDDAIREHLELKRRRGADPGLVAREERDALGAVRPGGADDEPERHEPEPAKQEPAEPEPSRGTAAEAADRPAGEAHPSPGEGVLSTGQETAELDMRTVLEEEADGGEHAARPVRAPSHHDTLPEASYAEDSPEAVEDVLEETPDFLKDTPDQDRLWFEQRPPRDFDFDK